MIAFLLAAAAAGLPVYVPPGATAGAPAPLLVVCHGQGGTAEKSLSNYRVFAEAEGWAILALQGSVPDGEGFTWDNDPENGKKAAEAVRKTLDDHPGIDRKRIAWVGMSAGCWACCQYGAPLAGDLCHGIVLVAASCACLAPPPEGRAPPRVCAFLGTEDFNFKAYDRRLEELKRRNAVYSLNTVEGLGHAFPRAEYLRAALAWVLRGEGGPEENRLPNTPPKAEDLKCRHLLVRHKGAAGPGTPRAQEEARELSGSLRDRLQAADAAGRRELAGSLSEDAVTRKRDGALEEKDLRKEGDLLRWACWTLKPGEVRRVHARSGFHLVWSDLPAPAP